MNAHNGTAANRWYEGITRYQWLVLLIASLGWVFDIFEGQIFVASMKEAMPSLLPKETLEGTVDFYNNIALGAFLIGGALGGIVFGMVSDKIGRTTTMILTILVYSLFTCVTALAQTWWQMAILRFLVAMGTGGEWAVASAMVAEVFPRRARAWSLGIFHASSVLGTWLAVLAGAFVVGNPNFGWRWGFVLGALPALLTVWIRWRLREPEQWVQARELAKTDATKRTGRLLDLFTGDLLGKTLVGLTLATVGLATFWGVHIYGRELLRKAVEKPFLADAEPTIGRTAQAIQTVVDNLLAETQGPVQKENLLEGLEQATPAARQAADCAIQAYPGSINRDQLRKLPEDARKTMAKTTLASLSDANKQSIKYWEMIGMFLVTTGGGIGLVSFGPLCERIGRRGAFLLFHVGGLVSALVLFQGFADASAHVLCVLLPVFGFLTLGMHAGYAIYFPELFPTRLRGTGGGVCFNGGRILAASILLIRGWMRNDQYLGLSLETTASILSLLFLIGVVVLIFAPETKGRELPT